MNTVRTIQLDEVKYASRTLETILLTNQHKKEKVVYLYNYEGVHFRIFDSIFEVGNFFNGECYLIIGEYSQEKWVDKFLEKYEFV